ncbi:hypothetical protein GF337_11605 [candidate division KSB1 bacterium]|nr:hypothetical protein [candidate division KSB1 bacterium]
MAKLNDLLKEMAEDIPGIFSVSVIGMDGLGIAHHSTSSDFDIEATNAQFALVMKLVQKSTDQINDVMEDGVLTAEDMYIMMRFIGDSSFFLGITADANSATLGNVRLVTRQYSDAIWQAIPKRK